MLLLTDGTVMVEAGDRVHWMRLTPDAHGSYVNGSWQSLPQSVMGTPRLYFASQVLPSGKVWVLGGEYSGIGLAQNVTGSGEVFDPATNRWAPIAPFPSQPDCVRVSQFNAVVTAASPVISNIDAPEDWQPGWLVLGPGIPAGAVIVKVDSLNQIEISRNATGSGGTSLLFATVTSGNLTSGSNAIEGIPSTAGYQTDWGISGPGIPAGSTVVSIDSPTSLRISQNATATTTSSAFLLTVARRPANCFGDDPSILMPGGKVLTGDLSNASTFLYDVATNSWVQGPNKAYNDPSDEEGWARIADGSLITYDIFQSIRTGKGYAERYDPVSNRWTGISPSDGSAKGALPLLSSVADGAEMGPLVRLYDDRVLALGANGHTALYTPGTNTWAPGPDMVGTLGGLPFLFGADDAPAAVLPNGHVMFAADAGNALILTGTLTAGSAAVIGIPSTAQLQPGWGVAGPGIPSGTTIVTIDSASQVTLSQAATQNQSNEPIQFGMLFGYPTQLFDFDPAANAISPVSPSLPDPLLNFIGAFVTRMLMLPTGQMLLSDSSAQLWIYTPDGAADERLRPQISSVSAAGYGIFQLRGTQLTGQSAGSAYGDDVQSDENYPIVRFTDATGLTYYARTSQWSYIGVGGGTTPQTVEFAINPQMPAGTYLLTVSAAGLSSDPVMAVVNPFWNTFEITGRRSRLARVRGLP